MSLSLFVLALWVFLQSSVQLAWFTVDPKLIGFVGILFVILVIVEGLFVVYRGRPLFQLHRHAE